MNRKVTVFLTALIFSASGFCSCGETETIEIRPDSTLWVPEESQKEYFSTEICTAPEYDETKMIPVTSENEKEVSLLTDSVSVSESLPSPSDENSGSSENNKEPGKEDSKKEEQFVPAQESPSPEVPVKSQTPSPLPSPSVPPSVPSEISVELKYADGVLIVNKSYPVPSDYVPENLILAPGSSEEYLLPEVCDAFREMSSAAWSEGLTLWVQSGYRSYQLQTRLYNNYVSQSGKEAADTFSARPGHSEHHTGLAFDLNTITDSFAYTEEGKWVAANCHKYGFIIRYPKYKESITGYKYEPWHLRYLGKELAEKVYNSGLCLEEYYGLTSEYSN